MLIVGAVTCDVFDGLKRPGGVAMYASRAATALEVRVRILTIAGPDASLEALGGHAIAVVPATQPLTFEHDLSGPERRLRLLARPGRALAASDLPREWGDSGVLVLGPMLPDDLDVSSFDGVTARRRGLLAQGLQREVDDAGRVSNARRPSEQLLEAVDARTSVFVSDEEIADWPAEALPALAAAAERVVVTHGRRGAEVFLLGERVFVPAVQATSVDGTGGGDVFATAFMISLARGLEDADADRVAAALASEAVTRMGPAALPRAEGGER